jgi:hypothetical protein
MTGEQITTAAVAQVLAEHQPTTGLAVASGVTCRCGYWNGVEVPGKTRPVGYSGLMWHQAEQIAALYRPDQPTAAPMDVVQRATWLNVLIDCAQDALNNDGGYLSADERAEIVAALEATKQWPAPTVTAEQVDDAVREFTHAWEAKNRELNTRRAPEGTRSRAGLLAALTALGIEVQP